jgi:transposase
MFLFAHSGIKKRARYTDRLRAEAVASLVQDNSTCPKASRRLSRCFNTTGSKFSIDRWKHQEADKYVIAEIIQKLGFSGTLCVDEYKPSRAKTYDLIDSDGRTGRILYVTPIECLGRGLIKNHFQELKNLGINPQVVIFDMRKVFPNAARKAFPEVLIQHDYFHVMKTVHWHLRNAMAEFRQKLKEKGFYTQDLWECRWIILKNLENWTSKDHKAMQRLLNIYSGTVIEDILVIKEQIRNIFLKSQDKKEAYLRRDELCNNEILKQNEHFANIFKFLVA